MRIEQYLNKTSSKDGIEIMSTINKVCNLAASWKEMIAFLQQCASVARSSAMGPLVYPSHKNPN